MSITKHPTLPNTYIIRLYAGGRKKSPKTGKTNNERTYELFEGPYEQAFDYHEKRKREIQGISRVSTSPTLKEAFPDFLAHYKGTVQSGTIRDFLFAWKHLEPVFGGLRFNYITPQIVTHYKTMRIEQGVTPRTVTKELSYLSAFVNWACLPEINYANPLPFKIKGFPNKQNQAPATYLLSRREIDALIENIHPEKRTILLLYTDLGLRRTEALNLRGIDVDLDRRLVRVFGKGMKEVWLYIITDRLFSALKARKEKHGLGYLFLNKLTGKPYGDIKEAIKEAAVRAGIEKRIYNHLLRHNFCTILIESGVDINVVQAAMRHSKISTTMAYRHMNNRFIVDELSKYSESLGEKQTGSLRQKKLRRIK